MTIEQSLRLKMNWKAKKGNTPCRHQRMVDSLVLTGRGASPLLACCECGAIIPDQVLKNNQSHFFKVHEPTLAVLS